MAVEPANAPTPLHQVARRLVWWKTPDEALAAPQRLVAQVMTLGNWDDVQTTRQVLGESAFRAVLSRPPAGVFDPRSWAYWHAVFGIRPVPPLPLRCLP